jgi:SM-20-related protein
MNLVPKYCKDVDGKLIYVFDDICSVQEATSIFHGLEASAFKRNEVARPDTAEYKHWVVNLADQQITSLPAYKRIIAAIEESTGEKYRAYRAYTNYASFGDMLFTHTDCMPESDELTALVYICPKWDLEWGGETLFYNDQDDCVFACNPKPGRTVIFHGAIKHVGRPPNRICYMPRFTLAFKLEKVPI